MAATKFITDGSYGQVEPNHLSAQRTGQIYAQLPLDPAKTQLENGQFVKYDYANHEVNFDGEGEWMLVFNEVKVYDDRETAADFVYTTANSSAWSVLGAANPIQPKYGANGASTLTADPFGNSGLANPNGQPYPRVFKTNVGDIFTTNLFMIPDGSTASDVDHTMLFTPGADGILVEAAKSSSTYTMAEDMLWQVCANKGDATGTKWTLPDGRPARKFQRIK